MLNTANHSKLIAGLIDQGVEFFVHANEVKCIHAGQVYSFEQFPEWIIKVIEEDMVKHPEALKALATWENLHQTEYVRQYIYCRFGGLDFDPDIDSNRKLSYAEYFDCGFRGVCKYEGKLCCTIKVSEGHLTKTEIEVLKRVALADKSIADELCISTDTVNSHLQNIRRKTGYSNKVELAIFATKKGIIN
jgi:DNA-binding CsgD family transcriptional regulator